MDRAIIIEEKLFGSCFATEDQKIGMKAFLDKVKGDTDKAMSVGGLSSTIKNVIGVVQVICYSAAVIMLILIGVKFITASPEGKAEIKKAAIQYVIGAIIVFAAGTLLGIIANMSTSVVTSSNS